ncbi:hypothetical protein MRX96_046786 [Rhipicephalus microplus]
MTTHWIVHPLRSWLGLMSITNLGAGVRCLLKRTSCGKGSSPSSKIERCPEMERTFAFWSLYNGVLVLHCSIFLEQPAVYSATLCCLAVYLVYFGNEMFIHGSICMAGKAVLFPVLLSATLVWMLVARQYIWVRRRHDATDTEENEQLEERLSLQNMRRLRRARQASTTS